MSICRPFTAIIFHNSSKCIVMSNIFAWMMALLWSMMPFVGWSSYAKEDDNIRCSINWNGNTVADKAYIAMLYVWCFLIPCSIMLLAFIAIKLELRQMNKQARKLTGFQMEAMLERIKAWKKHTKLAIVMAGTYITLWTPYASISFWTAYFKHIAIFPAYLGTIAAVFAKISSLTNAIIYSFLHEKFRHNLSLPFKGRVFRSQNQIGPDQSQKTTATEKEA